MRGEFEYYRPLYFAYRKQARFWEHLAYGLMIEVLVLLAVIVGLVKGKL